MGGCSLPGMLVRKAAMETLNRVIYASVKADTALAVPDRELDARDCGLLHELVYGVLRRFYSLEADMSRYCRTKPDDMAHMALLLGTYQLRHMRVPAHAAVSETVAAIKALQPKAAGFVNAVLRHVAASEPPEKLRPYQQTELPKWLYAAWRDAFGADEVRQFCRDMQQTPPLCLAVFGDRDDWLDRARAAGMAAAAGELSPHAVLLPAGTPVTQLPGFAAGDFVVMDQAAQMAVLALQADQPRTIIDLCAAPGGKTALLAHRFPDAAVIAVELRGSRLPRLRENLARLDCPNVRIVQADTLRLPLADGMADAVLLDAPCSASGVLRRHPDAKFLHDREHVRVLAERQRSMLTEALRLLKSDGRLVYAVCSIHPEENEEVTAPLALSGRRLFPTGTHDGFYIAVN